MRWLALGFCVAAVVGCRGLSGTEPLTDPGAIDGGLRATAVDGSSDPTGRADAASDGRRGVGPAKETGDAALPMCAPLQAPDTGTDVVSITGWSPPTVAPFSCNPMPNAFFFPHPGVDVPGVFARCASFDDAQPTALAISSDGSRVALTGFDGVARIVDVGSRTVVGVLAPARASVGWAAFSPSGDTIVTIAPGERLVTLWRADSFTPIWTTTLPGQTYQLQYRGTGVFSPDGATVLVSPGDSLYLLDASTGAIRVASTTGAVLNAEYGWNGRRIAVLTAQLAGMCEYDPTGGSVSILDPTTLALIATPVTWPLTSDESPPPGQMEVAAGADLIVTRGSETASSALMAFRISDGGPVAAPAISTFPLALTPDGSAALLAEGGTLELVRLADGVVTASAALTQPEVVAISADGSTIAAGSTGDSLLTTWRPASGLLVPTCTAALTPSDGATVQTSLSADGATIAVNLGDLIHVVRRTDGTTVSTIAYDQDEFLGLNLSPDARYLVAEFLDLKPGSSSSGPEVYRTSDGQPVANLQTDILWPLFFSRDDRLLDGLLAYTGPGTTVMQANFDMGKVTSGSSAPGYATLVGLSGDCPLLIDANGTLTRSCSGCQALPVAKNTKGGLVSLDGTMYLSQGGSTDPMAAVLWNIGSAPSVIRTYSPRPEDAIWNVSETPLAISAHGERIITGAREVASCSHAPGFTSRVRDVASDAVVDELPPGPTSASADLSVVAYGPVLWCAR
ncbi:MAG TPA: WD40 repeat domain-containing protein [Polyangia bacterium]|nr:WD40 repeat domain-containing protein [Polyangia bacterium]